MGKKTFLLYFIIGLLAYASYYNLILSSVSFFFPNTVHAADNLRKEMHHDIIDILAEMRRYFLNLDRFIEQDWRRRHEPSQLNG